MADPSLIILTPPRRGGRPLAAEPKTGLSTWIPVADHARLQAIAQRREVSLSQVVREWIHARLTR